MIGLNMQNYSDVINWVASMHDKQDRKGTQIPYVAHVNGVAFSLVTAGIEDRHLWVCGIKTAETFV